MATLQRPYDPVYDATYTVSGPRDHSREQIQGSGFLMEKVPTYDNLFSELGHHPSQTFRFRVDNRIPAHIDRNFHPQPSSTSDLGTRSKACQVTGSHRYKFFNRQIYSGLAASNSLEAALITGQDANVVEFQHEKPTSGTRTIGIQSDYRESECQTLPWEPEYHVPEKPSLKQQYRSSRFHCDGPEVLALKHLTFGNGLPAGLNEIDHIDKLRAKRAFEASLPAIDDLEQLPIRQQLIEEWEEKDWAERCNEIAGLQAERLAFLEEAIECREQRRDEEVQAIVQSRKERHVSMNEKAVASIEKQRVKTVRHLSSLRKQAGVLWPKRKASFVHEYANYGSQKYAPLQRLGQFPDNQPPGKQIVTESFQPETIKEVSDLETYMRGHLKEAKVQGPSKELLKGHQSRKTLEVHKILRTISSKLEQAKGTNGLGYGDCWLSPIDEILEQPSAVSKGKFAARPRTPTVKSEGDIIDAALITLQRLLRGRAVQNYMFEGVQRREDLIRELKRQEYQQGEPSQDDGKDKQKELDQLVGGYISDLLCKLTSDNMAASPKD